MSKERFQKGYLSIFLSYYRPHLGLFLLDMACALGISLVDLAFPYFSRYSMNELLPQSLYQTFFAVMAILFAAYVLRAGMYYIVGYYGHMMGVRIEADIRRDVFGHMQDLSFSFYDKNRTGQLMSRATNDLFEITELAHHGPEDLFISCVTLIGAFCMMMSIQWKLALIVFAVVPIFVVYTVVQRRRMVKASAEVKQRMAGINGELESSISGMRTAKAFANEEAELRRRYPDKLIRFLPNGVDVDKFARPAAFDWHRELKLEDGVRILLNVSRIDYQKNQKLLVRLLAELKARGDRVHLLLIGPVTAEWYGRELLALAESLQVREQLTLVPGLPPDDERLAAAYQQAEVFLLPSLHEPFGIVVLEAWSAGVPVLAARVGGLRYLVEEGKTGLQFDPEALPSLLAAYDALPPLRMQLGRNARAEVAARYGWPVIGRQLAEFYREVIAYYNHRDLRNGKSSE